MKKYIVVLAVVIALAIVCVVVFNNKQFKAGELEPCSNMAGAVCKTECGVDEQQYINGDCGE